MARAIDLEKNTAINTSGRSTPDKKNSQVNVVAVQGKVMEYEA